MEKKRVFIVGPTGVGKSALGIRLAQKFHGGILSMDSMQIYRGMDIGTAKVTAEEQRLAPHYLIDVANPGVRYTVQDYQTAANEMAEMLIAQDMLPIFVGGTGLYLDALVHDYQFTGVDTNASLRESLRLRYDADEGKELFEELHHLDPEAAQQIGPNNRPRLIRAMEIYLQTGQIPSQRRHDQSLEEWENLILVLSMQRPALYDRIDRRVEAMVEQGLIAEVQGLLENGVDVHSQAMQAIGYREINWFLRGLVSREEAIRLIQQFSRNYAKRQFTWYKRHPEAIWLSREEEEIEAKASQLVEEFLAAPPKEKE